MRLNREKSEALEVFLKERGYTRYVQHFKSEDFLYWKSFERIERGQGGYSAGIAFYDFSKFPQFTDEDSISISFEFMLGNNQEIDRMDLTISDDRITVEEFEDFCKKFYDFYNENKKIKTIE